MELVVPEEIHHVVEIAGSRPLSKCSEFFSEDFFVAIAPCRNCLIGCVGIGMGYRAKDRRQNQYLVGREVELDPWQLAG